ncbi:sigma-70 family RNA polymerase sigma factor [uncultured Aquimarina sp.]|uniref:sigma-70 family RNA polymerase sigma factor n=1 Tax=uncultured Aquimarina sp. TaxID=575652 RepID=UPI002629755D|nr:sigma-70 family RNA polymerase sigma factor [uncultured Aquimarina sp.]
MDIEYHLLTISEKGNDEKEAKTSLDVLYKAFRSFIYSVVKEKIKFFKNSDDIAKSVTHDVIMYIWNNPLEWNFDQNVHTTPEGGFKAYLATVADYSFKTEFKKVKKFRDAEINPSLEDENLFKSDLNDEELETLSDNASIIEDALNELPEKSREIVRMYFMFYEEEKNMSSEAYDFMENMFKTTRDNIRQIISRAKKRIKTATKDKIQFKK